jgi:hypothetical protein
MVILLSIEESQNQIIGGFPEFVILTSNVPSTIFYTLDGTEPTEDSEIFVDKLVIPTTGITITLKAVAISGMISSSTLEETYFTDHSELGKVRHTGKEGINILPPGVSPVDHLSLDADGDWAQSTTIPFQDLDVVASTTNDKGEDIPGDTTIDFINFAIEVPLVPNKPAISSPNNNINFDPTASYIIIDGTTPEAIENQTVRIINRPHGTMDLLSRMHNQNMSEYQITSSNFVRSMIDPKSGKITFYYRDSRENRWIKSTQKVEGKGLNLTPKSSGTSSFVFRWIEDRAQSKIY